MECSAQNLSFAALKACVKQLPSLFYHYCKLQLCSPPSLVTAPFYMTARAHPALPSHLHHLQPTHPSHIPQFPSPHPFTATQDAQANPASDLIICKKNFRITQTDFLSVPCGILRQSYDSLLFHSHISLAAPRSGDFLI